LINLLSDFQNNDTCKTICRLNKKEKEIKGYWILNLQLTSNVPILFCRTPSMHVIEYKFENYK